MIKTAKQLVAACLDVVKNYKTLYVMGCFGAPMTPSNKTRYINGYSFNAKDERRQKILAADSNTFGFDCVCFIKALFWGWKGDPSQVYGGAQYKANGIPDMGADQMIKACSEVGTDFSNIVPGELVWQPGHVGIYIGDGLAAEATYEPEEGVQLQCVLPMGVKPGMPATGWQKHGKLPWISYEAVEKPADDGTRYRLTIANLTQEAADELMGELSGRGYVCSTELQTAPVPEPSPLPEHTEEWIPKEGDIVQFNGGMQYSQSNGTAGGERSAGQAKITKTAPGARHPYHLVKTGSVGPYGWVDRDTFTKA